MRVYGYCVVYFSVHPVGGSRPLWCGCMVTVLYISVSALSGVHAHADAGVWLLCCIFQCPPCRGFTPWLMRVYGYCVVYFSVRPVGGSRPRWCGCMVTVLYISVSALSGVHAHADAGVWLLCCIFQCPPCRGFTPTLMRVYGYCVVYFSVRPVGGSRPRWCGCMVTVLYISVSTLSGCHAHADAGVWLLCYIFQCPPCRGVHAHADAGVRLLCYIFQCPPCRGFTPTLMRVYERLRADGRNFEVVLVSSDRSEESYRTYVSAMPWLAVPYGDQRCANLTKHFGVQGEASHSLRDPESRFYVAIKMNLLRVVFVLAQCELFWSCFVFTRFYTFIFCFRYSNPDHPGRKQRHHHDERSGATHQGSRRQGASPTHSHPRFSTLSTAVCKRSCAVQNYSDHVYTSHWWCLHPELGQGPRNLSHRLTVCPYWTFQFTFLSVHVNIRIVSET